MTKKRDKGQGIQINGHLKLDHRLSVIGQWTLDNTDASTGIFFHAKSVKREAKSNKESVFVKIN